MRDSQKMFEKVILTGSNAGSSITAGEIAESLLFYRNVHVVFHDGTLLDLLSKIKPETLMEVLRRPGFSAVHCQNQLATLTNHGEKFNIYQFTAIGLSGDEKGTIFKNRKERLRSRLERNGIEKKKAKIFTYQFCEKVPSKKWDNNDFIDGGLLKAATDDLNDENYVYEAVRIALENKFRSPIGDFKFKVIRENDEKFTIESNLDYIMLNNSIGNIKPEGYISEGHILISILQARSDLILAGYYGNEIYTNSVSSGIIKLKLGSILKRMEKNSHERENFTDVVTEGKSIREAIDSGERSFEDFLKLLDKADRFKEWIVNMHPDTHLVKEYLNEVSRQSWLEKWPSKIIRYALTKVVGAIEPITGELLSVGDNFLVDKLKIGWKPSHFVEKRLNPFLNEEQ
jgi:hypothetical protein